ncbi:MAG: cardiolipin synthase, partial [Nanoarchaeota archaeon]|nr:cardiolipin synthase [Nanoarchaeota archaeon]
GEIEAIEKDVNLQYQKELLRLLRNNSNSILTSSNRVEILKNGKEKFEKLVSDLSKAEKFIHMEYFIWRKDILTEKIKNILIEKAKSGVEVRILYDALGGFFLSHKYIYQLRKGGVKIYPYFNFLRPFRFHTLNYRNHRKIVVIDGNVAYTGGMNMAEEYIDGGERFESWKDTHLRLKGDVVEILQGIFATSWFNTTKEKLFSSKYFPIGKKFKEKTAVQITTSGPDSQWDSIKQLYFTLISSAEKRVYIKSPYLVPDSSVMMALKVAALSGIDVRIMVTGVADKYLPYWAAQTYFKDLLKAGVKIYKYKKGFMHSKSVCVDGTVCSIGTANMDVRSFYFNYEINSMIYDGLITKDLETEFLEDQKDCKEITLESISKVREFVNFRNSVARLFAPLL